MPLHYLSPENALEIVNASRGMFTHLLKDFPRELPSTIIIPDTSARPLAYLVKAVFAKVAIARNVPVPKIYFMQPVRTESAYRVRLFEQVVKMDAAQGITELKETVEASERGEIKETKKNREEGRRLLNNMDKDWAELMPLRALLKTRADELKRFIGTAKDAVIIDDGATPYAVTSKEIGKALGFELPTYVLEAEFSNEFFAKEGLNIKTGAVVPKKVPNKPRTSYWWDQSAVGVVKDKTSSHAKNPYKDWRVRNAELGNKFDVKSKMGDLRKDLDGLGKIIGSVLAR